MGDIQGSRAREGQGKVTLARSKRTAAPVAGSTGSGGSATCGMAAAACA